MEQEEVDQFFKKDAFGLHWENEIPDSEETIRESDEDASE